MANRVLKRPMFRMGGSPQYEFQEKTSGILSGMDGPKINASRTGLKEGGLSFAEIIEAQDKASKEYLGEDDYTAKQGMPGSMSSALMNFGLNLLAQPGGNLAGAIGKAGSPVLKQFQAARESERLDKRKSERDRKRDVLDRAADIFETQIEAGAEAGKDNRFAFEATQETMKKLQDDEITINTRIEELTKKQGDGTITDIEIAELERQKINKANNEELQVLITKEKKSDPVAEAILKGVANGIFTFEDYKAYKESGEYPKGLKDGGRAGYQVGGEVVEEVASMTETAPVSPVAQNQTQDLTYDELRARLPREITDDVVTLIATSKAALADFANIQTQRDVDNFNQMYNVNLVLPQED
jgi:hypothetical protein